MQRVLVQRIRADLRNAFLAKGDGDEWVLQTAAYHVQQAIEKCLKQVYVECGVDYRHTHEIGSLVKNLPAEQRLLSIASLADLEDMLDSLEKWEAATRYDDPYMATRRRVDRLYTFAEQLYAELCASIDRLDAEAEAEVQADKAVPPKMKNMNLFGK